MKTILIYPPFADPTQSYVSLPVLKGYLGDKGFDAKMADFNIEAIHHIFERKNLDILIREIHTAYDDLNGHASLSIFEQLKYKELVRAMTGIGEITRMNDRILDVFKTDASFYDNKAYNEAVKTVNRVFDALNALHFPFRFGFNQAGHFTLPWSLSMLESYVGGMKSPLSAFYAKRTASGLFRDADIAGISLTFVSQISEAFHIARLVKKANPHSIVIIGGTAMSQIALSMKKESLVRLFDYADYLCTGDGEEALVGLLRALGDSRNPDPSRLASIPNIVFLDPKNREPGYGPEKPFDIRTSPPPDYSDLDLDSYLAPRRVLLYSPTRRCYWRKCSFCTYGMSFSKEYGYREIRPEKAASDLEFLSKRYGVCHFYFSCDVLSPQYAERLAQEISKRGLAVHWSSDLRIESAYTDDVCLSLYESGLRAAAFGVESGSDRMLALIDKGITRSMIRSVNAAFHKAGIATQWMTFTYHPGETPSDAGETLDLLEEELDSIDLFIVGEFQLIPGSRIYDSPGAYGIKRVYFTRGDELGLYPLFTLSDDKKSSLSDRQRIDSRIDRIASRFALNSYPWAGAISTHHSFLYFLLFGPSAFKRHARAHKRTIEPTTGSKSAQIKKPRFSLRKIKANEEYFFAKVHNALEPIKISGPDNPAYEAALSEQYIDELAQKMKPLYPINENPDC